MCFREELRTSTYSLHLLALLCCNYSSPSAAGLPVSLRELCAHDNALTGDAVTSPGSLAALAGLTSLDLAGNQVRRGAGGSRGSGCLRGLLDGIAGLE